MNLSSIIESILFASGDPLSVSKISKITGESEELCINALNELRENLKERGIILIELDNTYQLGTSPEAAKFLQSMQKEEISGELSKASLETLAIIAYKGPLGRSQIDYIRGVNSSYIIRNLLMRGLIERIDNPLDSRTYYYKVSMDFLKHFGFSSIKELPEYDSLAKEEIKLENDSEEN